MYKLFHYFNLVLFSLFIQTSIAQNVLNTKSTAPAPSVNRRIKVIKLSYTPREVLIPSTNKKIWDVPLNIQDIKDSHSDQLDVVGQSKYTEYIYTIKVTSVTSVGSFATKVLKKKHINWGGTTGIDTYILESEILDFFVSEENLYYTRFKIKFTLKDNQKNKLWAEVFSGTAKVFGMSMREKNFNEGFSDVLQEAYVKLFENDGFVSACLGEKKIILPKQINFIELDTLKNQLLLLIKENFDEQSQIMYVKQRALASPLSADQMIDWKKAGIPQSVISEVIKQGSADK